MKQGIQKTVTVLAGVMLISTGYWMVTRSARIAEIDHELNLGYATDRFGEPSVPGKPDSGEVWRAEQVSRDNQITLWVLVAAVPSLLWVIVRVWNRPTAKGKSQPQDNIANAIED